MADSKTVITTLTENSNVQLGLVFVMAGALIGAIWWASNIDTRLGTVQQSVNKIESSLEGASNSRWTKLDHDAFEARLKIERDAFEARAERRAQELERRSQDFEKSQRDLITRVMILELKKQQP